MNTVTITKHNELYIRVDAERSILKEISERFSFMVPGSQYSPAFKAGVWDGRIKLFNVTQRTLYSGLLLDLITFCNQSEYEYSLPDKAALRGFKCESELELFKANIYDYTSMCVEGVYDYQLSAFIKCVSLNKALCLSPTGSGKSHIIYLLVRFLLDQIKDNVLICVPNTSLCSQLIGDFEDYTADEWIAEDNCHKIYAGQDKTTDKRVVISTFQSLVKMPDDWFKRYGCIIIDEAHQADSKSIIQVINNMAHAPWRLGFTGTLDGTNIHELCMRGLFGPTVRTKSTKELMELGVLAKLKIEANILKYSKEDCNLVRSSCKQYQAEIAWLLNNPQRNEFIINKAMNTGKNTLVLFNMISHGEVLLELAKARAEEYKKEIYFVSGKIKTDERERIRALLETRNDIILIASYGVFSTGTNVKNLDYAIFAHPYKARIRNLQSIGRAIRKNDGKEFATLIDIGDNLTQNKKPNITYTHFVSRLKIYEAEQFEYTITDVSVD